MKILRKFPCEDLYIINQLWLDYSKKNFGFSIQRDIWLSVNLKIKKQNISDKIQPFQEYAKTVGWYNNNNKLEQDIVYELSNNTPRGYLPIKYLGLSTQSKNMKELEDVFKGEKQRKILLGELLLISLSKKLRICQI